MQWETLDKSIAKIYDGNYLQGEGVGETYITARYRNLNRNVCVKIREEELLSIEISKMPDKLVYYLGTNIDLTGIEIIGHYTDGTTKIEELEEYSKSNYFTRYLGIKEITIKIGGFSDTFEINVIKKDSEVFVPQGK